MENYGKCHKGTWFALASGRSFCVSEDRLDQDAASAFCQDMDGYLADVRENEWHDLYLLFTKWFYSDEFLTSGKRC